MSLKISVQQSVYLENVDCNRTKVLGLTDIVSTLYVPGTILSALLA